MNFLQTELEKHKAGVARFAAKMEVDVKKLGTALTQVTKAVQQLHARLSQVEQVIAGLGSPAQSRVVAKVANAERQMATENEQPNLRVVEGGKPSAPSVPASEVVVEGEVGGRTAEDDAFFGEDPEA